MTDGKPGLVAMRDARDKTIAALSDHFAADSIDVDEFERRLDLAHSATEIAALDALVDDLPALPSTALVVQPAAAIATVPESQVVDRQRFISVMGGTERRGSWAPARHIRIVAVMGGAVLDFREAQMAPGVTEVSIFALMGGTEIIVPPGLSIEMDGTGIIGGFEHVARSSGDREPSAPLLRIHGFAMMGGVSVTTRMPGESGWQARKRERLERRALRDAERAERKQLKGG